MKIHPFKALQIEYENRIKLDSLPGVETADAFSHEDVREIVRCAEENGLKVIPLLQSLGHLEYLLQLPAYRKYSELQTDFSQFCPLNDEAFELWKKAFDEMRSLHPDSEYFHIGGDETRQLGKCPACAKFAKDHSREELFFQHISRVCQYAVSKGVRPVLWHDMLARSGRFDLLAKLPKETVLLYWEYISKEDSLSRILFKERTLVSRNWIGRVRSFRDFTEAPKAFVSFIEDEPQELPEAFRKPAVLPLLEPMKETGLTVWGASSLGYSPCGTLLSDTDRVHSNMRMWRDSGIEGDRRHPVGVQRLAGCGTGTGIPAGFPADDGGGTDLERNAEPQAAGGPLQPFVRHWHGTARRTAGHHGIFGKRAVFQLGRTCRAGICRAGKWDRSVADVAVQEIHGGNGCGIADPADPFPDAQSIRTAGTECIRPETESAHSAGQTGTAGEFCG